MVSAISRSPAQSWWDPEFAAVAASMTPRAPHTLLEHPYTSDELVSDEALVETFDLHRDTLECNVMGTDLTREDEWSYVDVQSASSAEVLQAVHDGRLWVNVVGVKDGPWGRVAGELRDLVQQSVDVPLQRTSLNLVISSPTAMVYYHSDPNHTLLIHTRGHKRIWVYPALDSEIVDRNVLQNVFGGQVEELPYRPEFDERAACFDLTPGAAVAWSTTAPHRVENVSGLNVSASFNFWTSNVERMRSVMAADRYLRRTWHVRIPGRFDAPVRSTAARALARVGRRLRPEPPIPRLADAPPTWVLDPSVPSGARPTQ